MVWIYYKFARVEQNCGKQRQLKQLPDEMWKRKPMSGGAGIYPVSAKPITRCMEPQTVRTSEVNREWRAKLAATSEGEPRRKSWGSDTRDREDGLGEFYD
jgi:hypothetical protein